MDVLAEKFAVLGGDSRMRYAALAIGMRGFHTDTFAVEGLPDTKRSLSDAVSGADYILLPLPSLGKDGGIVNRQGLYMDMDEVLAARKEGAIVFIGKADGLRGENIVDYFAWEQLAIYNAVPTAEGAIQLAMENMPVTVYGSCFLVIGAGNIGMCLARRLSALGAIVAVSARKERDFAAIRCAGMEAEKTHIYAKGLERYDCVINTVPAQVLTAEQLERLREDCLIMELASAPGGFSAQTAKLLGKRFLSGAALPGKVAPQSAGEIIADCVLNYISNQGGAVL